ncbi:hypothetical protein GGF32_005482 [Allomyces javanicus]|nr:hypothetical protein GGF32_005482 [Allomyces javanicus]
MSTDAKRPASSAAAAAAPVDADDARATCCCCIDLRTGVYILLLLEIALTLWSVISNALSVATLMQYGLRPGNSETANYVFSFVVNGIGFGMACMALHAVYKDDARQFKIFYTWELIALVLMVLNVVVVVALFATLLAGIGLDMGLYSGVLVALILVPCLLILLRVYIVIVFRRMLRKLERVAHSNAA